MILAALMSSEQRSDIDKLVELGYAAIGVAVTLCILYWMVFKD